MRRRQPVQLVVPVAVIGGLIVSALLAVFPSEPVRDLPGAALGSPLLLAAERGLALFGAWLIAVIVVVRAMAGDLPTEISGQGIRYASREATELSAADARHAMRSLEAELKALRESVFEDDTKDK